MSTDATIASPARRRVRPRRVAAAASAVLVALVAGLWAERRPIAASVVDRRLAAAHVPARYRIADLGLGRQRLVDVVVGDPGHPDLTADWVELGTRIGLDGVSVTAVRAGRLRLRGALVGGRLSLGSLDRLLPVSTGGGPFRLPAIDLDVGDGGMLLSTPAGPVTLRLAGRGRLDGGFRGSFGLASPRLVLGGCVAERVGATGHIVVRSGPALDGAVGAGALHCGTVAVTGVSSHVALGLDATFSRWGGDLRLAPLSPAAPGLRLVDLAGTASFHGTAASTRGTVALTSATLEGGGIAARRGGLAGRVELGRTMRFAGQASVSEARLPAGWLSAAARLNGAADATPAGPVATRIADAAVTAARSFDARAALVMDGSRVTVRDLVLRAPTGASVAFSGGQGVSVPLDAPRPSGSGVLRTTGGGLPTVTVRLVLGAAGEAARGVLVAAPYRAGDANVALTPVSFALASDGGLTVRSTATVSGPLANGRVEGLVLPVALARYGKGRLALDPGCTVVGFDRLTLGSLRLGAARLPLCPTGRALVEVDRGRVDAAARIAPVRLAGSVGSTPLTLSLGPSRLGWAQRSFAVADVTARLGDGASASRLDVGEVSGALASTGMGGRFARAAGQIGAVPLLLSDASGTWGFGKGALTLAGALTVSDAAPDARFVPLRAEGVTVTLADGAIAARARLMAPAKAVPVADVAIAHDLSAGSGHADLTVAPLAFGDRLQPDDLTRLTRGTIADVRGTVDGEARLAWSGEGVTSVGRFHTEALDLAAAFGPVTGLAGTIRFTDLLSLTSAPDQVATVASINPGVAVTDGRILFRTLPGSRVEVAGGRWPFAGGELRLEPASLDLSADTPRSLTFTLAGVDAARFLQQFDFGNISATGTFDGALPMVFDASGGRVEGGSLRVRHGGNIAYLGELTQKDLGTWGNLAFQALRSIDYRALTIAMNGPLAGEMITEIRFGGISQGKGARSNFLFRRLERLPFVFNIRIRAPFRGLVDSAQSFYDPTRLVARNLPALLKEQQAPAGQPSERENVPGPDRP